MRIIHCADIHLDAKMTANLPVEKAKERRLEILGTFRRMVEFAAASQVDAILIAGDLCDKKSCSLTVGNTVLALMEEHPQIQFFYLKGNHDADPIFRGKEKEMSNLFLFSSDRWSSYRLGDTNICITGTEPISQGAGIPGMVMQSQAGLFDELDLDASAYNILMLHGQITEQYGSAQPSRKGKSVDIPLKSLRNRGIDYLALGHVHKQMNGRLDGRGVWCYPGCLEGRGFDECGEHGFLLLDIDPETHKTEIAMIPMACRRLYELSVDISICKNIHEILRAIEKRLDEENRDSRDLVKIILTGETDLIHEIMTEYLEKQLEHLFYFVKVENEARIKVDYRTYLTDPSLKGAFVRQVMQETDLDEEDRTAVIRMGIRLLTGVDGFED